MGKNKLYYKLLLFLLQGLDYILLGPVPNATINETGEDDSSLDEDDDDDEDEEEDDSVEEEETR